MKFVYQRSSLLAQLQASYAQPMNVADMLTDPQMPQPLVDWLARLSLLHGVPFNYLVPDESMLPPESIRFFYLDTNWLAALADGAMSIGRTLSNAPAAPDLQLHSALLPTINEQVGASGGQTRAKAFGMRLAAEKVAENQDQVITGFLMRSSLVRDYPSMGVNVYPYGATPNDAQPRMLSILRLEQLGPDSDTLICLISGDAYRVDIHEAPQALHYGIDSFDSDCAVEGAAVRAIKHLYAFGNQSSTKDGVTTNTVIMSQTVSAVDISACFRPASPRVLSMDELAKNILATNLLTPPPPATTAPASIDSAEMGFEMTQGVGMVSFYKSTQNTL